MLVPKVFGGLSETRFFHRCVNIFHLSQRYSRFVGCGSFLIDRTGWMTFLVPNLIVKSSSVAILHNSTFGIIISRTWFQSLWPVNSSNIDLRSVLENKLKTNFCQFFHGFNFAGFKLLDKFMGFRQMADSFNLSRLLSEELGPVCGKATVFAQQTFFCAIKSFHDKHPLPAEEQTLSYELIECSAAGTAFLDHAIFLSSVRGGSSLTSMANLLICRLHLPGSGQLEKPLPLAQVRHFTVWEHGVQFKQGASTHSPALFSRRIVSIELPQSWHLINEKGCLGK